MNLSTRLRLGIGKLRRAYLQMLKRDYVRRSHARRRGECRRCGACCRLMFLCPYLEEDGEHTSCVCHDARWTNCKIFPIDERDLADRDLVSRDGPCGYSFEAAGKSRPRSSRAIQHPPRSHGEQRSQGNDNGLATEVTETTEDGSRFTNTSIVSAAFGVARK